MIQLKLSARGEIVIPKKIREHLGLRKTVILTIKDDMIELRPPIDVAKRAEERAKKYRADTSKWVMGDELYEQEFS